MILGKHCIERYVNGEEGKRIVIEPYRKEQLNTNSYDVCLGRMLYCVGDKEIDPMVKREYEGIEMGERFLLEKGKLYLGSTVEVVGSNYFVPRMEGKSSLGRLGLLVHCTAGFGDVGFINYWTLELISLAADMWIYPGMRIAQVVFSEIKVDRGRQGLYDGKYCKRDSNPVPSKYWMNGLSEARWREILSLENADTGDFF